MKILALDIGKKHTGVAYADTDFGIVSALPSITHASPRTLQAALENIVAEKGIQMLILGLPLLLNGTKGEQALFTQTIGDMLKNGLNKPIEYIDERLTNAGDDSENSHAKAACSIASVFLDRKK